MDILRESSLRDGLTGLYNRRFLEEYIEQEQAYILMNQKIILICFIKINILQNIGWLEYKSQYPPTN